MRAKMYFIVIVSILLSINTANGQVDSGYVAKDSINNNLITNYKKKLAEIEQQRVEDSIKKAGLEKHLKALKTTDNIQKEVLLAQIRKIEVQEQQRISFKKRFYP